MVQTERRWLITGKPKVWSPFKRVKTWDNKTKSWKKVWATRFRRVYTDGKHISLTPHPEMQSLETWPEVEFVRKWAKKKGWDLKVQRREVELYPHLTGDTDCHADLLSALEAMAVDLGVKIHVASGHRTMEEQTALYKANMDPVTGKPKPGHPLTARPNASAPHTQGIAADIWINGTNALAWSPRVREVATKHGVCFPVPGETWHAQLVKDTSGPKWSN